MLPNVKEFRCFGSGGKEFFRRRGSADGLFLGGMMRRRIVPGLFFVAVFFSPLLVSADSGFSVRDEAAGFFGGAVDEARRYARDELIFGESSLDFSEWLTARGVAGFDRVVVQRLVSGGVDYVEGLGFVRDVEVRYESPLGERAGNFGVGALGSLRESADDVVVWKLRGFVGEDDVAGANVGAAYRRLVSGDFLAGVNAFLDYERGDYDESFWRWSAGVEATGRHLDFSANRYWALSDAVMATVSGTAYRVYSADGWDAELRGRVAVRYPVAFRFLDSAEVAARYYVWEGDSDGTSGGDADVSGARYRLGFVPLPQLRFGVEYDDSDDTRVGGGGKNFGYYINFRHRLGGASDSLARDDGADVWSRRFDPVRREHQQHIMRTQAGAGVVTSVEIFLSSVTANMAVLTLSSYFPAGANYSYAVVSANPPGYAVTVLPANISSGIVTDTGAKVANSGGTVYFSVIGSGGGVNFEFTVFFRDLSVGVAGADDDGQVRLFLSSLTANAVLLTVMAGGGASPAIAVASAVPAAWQNLLSINQVNGEVTDNGLVADGRNGVVIFSVTDDDGAMVLLTVRFGDLVFDDVSVTVTSDDANTTIQILSASGGAGGYSYALVSTNPMGAAVSLSVIGDELIDNGLAAGGAATVSAFVSATDGDGFNVSAVVAVEVLDDVGVAEDDFAVTLTPDDAGAMVLTITASGGAGGYVYALVSTNPALFADSVTVNNLGVVIDSGIAVAGATMATAIFSATDSSGEMIVLVTVMIAVLDEFVLADDDFELTLVSSDAGAALQTLTVTGGASPYTFGIASADPSVWNNSLAINSNGIISDSGAAANRAAMATVFFSVTDNIGSVLTATVSLQTFADLVLANDDISLTLNSGDAGTAIQTLMASGGDGSYGYRLISGNGVAIDNSGVITDSGLASAGAASVTAIFEVTDDFAFTVSATVDIVVLDAVTFAEDNFSLTLSSADAGMPLLTLTASGTSPYTFTFDSANPSGSEVSLSTAGSGAEFVISDNGIAAGGAATATLEYKVTDGDSTEATATIHLLVVDDLAVANSSVSLALTFDDAGAEVVTLSVSGGVAPLAYAVVSVNPSGRGDLFAIDNNGVISEAGVVTVGGSGTVVFAVTDALNRVVNATVEFSYTAVKFAIRSQHAAVTFNGKLFVIGGTNGGSTSNRLNDVWSTSDGFNWVQETAAAAFPARQGHAAVVHNNKIYIIGGATSAGFLNRSNDVWSSADGVTWTQETVTGLPGRAFHQAAVLGGTIYVTGGQNTSFNSVNDVWYSTDGATWMEATADAGFLAREFFAMTTLNSSLYVVGGSIGGGGNANDVWSSANGVAWTQVTVSAAFSARGAHSAVALGNEIFIMAGHDGSNNVNDVWSSTDGETWMRETASAGFPARQGHASVIFNNRIYVLGGFFGGRRNDVWSSADGVNWIRH